MRCIQVTLTHNVHSGLSSLCSTAVGAGDFVDTVICPQSCLDEQCAFLALRLHNHPLFVDFCVISGPFYFWLRSASHHSRKPQRIARPDDDAIPH